MPRSRRYGLQRPTRALTHLVVVSDGCGAETCMQSLGVGGSDGRRAAYSQSLYASLRNGQSLLVAVKSRGDAYSALPELVQVSRLLGPQLDEIEDHTMQRPPKRVDQIPEAGLSGQQ